MKQLKGVSRLANVQLNETDFQFVSWANVLLVEDFLLYFGPDGFIELHLFKEVDFVDQTARGRSIGEYFVEILKDCVGGVLELCTLTCEDVRLLFNEEVEQVRNLLFAQSMSTKDVS